MVIMRERYSNTLLRVYNEEEYWTKLQEKSNMDSEQNSIVKDLERAEKDTYESCRMVCVPSE
eukprot:scaffold15044_cov37-Cyclotella_meneghiniana.AAC.5